MHDNLFMRLYYPTDLNVDNHPYAKVFYNPIYRKATLQFYDYKFAGIISGALGLLTEPRIPARLNAPLISAESDTQTQGPFPVLVYSHGLGAGFFGYSGICADIASHGYVVSSVEHADESASIALRRVPGGPNVPEGQYDRYVDQWLPYLKRPKEDFPLRNQQVRQRSQEVRKALDVLVMLNEGGEIRNMLGGTFDFSQFKDRLNTEIAAVAGHSFGGASTILALHEDQRFQCGIPMDVWMFPLHDEVYTNTINQPVMFINSHNFQWKENVDSILRLQNGEGNTVSCYTIKGTNHYNQSDGPFIMPASFNKNITQTELDPFIAHTVNMELVHAFLRRNLHKVREDVPLLDGGEGASEHVIFGALVKDKTTPPQEEEIAPPQEEDTPQQQEEVTPPQQEEVTPP
jgi:platelet-activating factor acetylhydrolase